MAADLGGRIEPDGAGGVRRLAQPLIDILKIDVEGAEWRVFEGAAQVWGGVVWCSVLWCSVVQCRVV